MPTQKTLDRILSLIKRGKTFKEIGEVLETSPHTVRYWMQKAREADPKTWSVAFRGSGKPPTPVKATDREIKQWVKKEGIKATAERYGVGRGVIVRRASS
jgi:predicted ArsR family transcriptional regulator